MKCFGPIKDNGGKEAFAYLAIILMVLSTFYVAYTISIQKDHDDLLRSNSKISDMRSDLTSKISHLKMEFGILHDLVTVQTETDIITNGEDRRLDGAIESNIVDQLTVELDDLVKQCGPDDGNIVMTILDWSVDTNPITMQVDTPVPSV